MAGLRELGLPVIETRGSPHIDIARSQLSCAALKLGADVVFFIDHDTLFDPRDVETLANVARDTRGLVGAPYSTRKMGGSVVGGIDPTTEEVTFFEGGGLYVASGVVGMGFTAIHRNVFALLDLFPEYDEIDSVDGRVRPYFQKLIVDGYWLGEDGSFCDAARRAGAGTFVDTRIRVKHLGDHPFGIEDCRRRSGDEPTVRIKIKPSET